MFKSVFFWGLLKLLHSIKSLIKSRLTGEIPTEKLIKMGLTIGRNFNRLNGCTIDPSHCWLITIGDDVSLAPGVHILAHDGSTKMYLGYTKIGRVQIGNHVGIGTGSIILPNVKIGNNVIIGAGSVVTKDIPDNSLAAGNPARIIGSVPQYIDKHRALMEKRPVFDENWTVRRNITDLQKEKMKELLKDGIGYVE